MVYVNEHTDLLDIESALILVSAQRREQALKFKHEEGRRLSLAVYILLMEGLKKEYGITEAPIFDYTNEGKPFIANRPDIHFSLSHSKNVALCAIGDQPIGADVETSRNISPSLINYTMSENEQEQIYASSNRTMQFLHFWTRKEALLKLTGEGIRNNMKNVLDEAEKYHFETIKKENYIYSIVKNKTYNL